MHETRNKISHKAFFCSYLLVLLSFGSCKRDFPCSNMEEHFKEYYYSPEAIRKSKIISRTKIEISSGGTESRIITLYSKGRAISPNKVRAIDYFNELGYLTLSVIPKYESQKADTVGFSKLNAMEKFLFPKWVETNMPTGINDSIFFNYDTKNRLIKKVYRKQTLFGISYAAIINTYEYDDKNNLVKSCESSDNSPTSCWIKSYEYDNVGRITTEIKETPEDIQRLRPGIPTQVKVKYSYYPDGKLKSKGSDNYLYENEKLREVNSFVNNAKENITKYQYDKDGYLVKVEYIMAMAIETNRLTGTNIVTNYDTSIVQFNYDERKLIIERWYKESIGKSKDNLLFKFNYN